jgi:hypothetical protein
MVGLSGGIMYTQCLVNANRLPLGVKLLNELQEINFCGNMGPSFHVQLCSSPIALNTEQTGSRKGYMNLIKKTRGL